MSIVLLKCYLVVLLTTHYVSASTKVVSIPLPEVSNGIVGNREQFVKNTLTGTGTGIRAGTLGDLLASRTGYTVSESGRSLGILTLALIIGIPVIIVLLFLIFLPLPMAIGRRTARMAQEVLESDECVERIACELLRFSRGMEYETEWMQRILSPDAMNMKSNSWLGRVSRGAGSPKCSKLTCDPVASLTKSLRR